MFEDRRHAGRLLAKRLKGLIGGPILVVGLPRGGIEVAAEVAAELGAELAVVVSRKIGAPGNPELAVGAVAPDRSVILDKELVRRSGATEGYLEREARIQGIEISRREAVYGPPPKPGDVRGKTVVLVDDGIATGQTMRAAFRFMKSMGPTGMIAAAPVVPAESVPEIRRELGRLVYVEAPADFRAIGAHYKKFPQLTDAEVKSIIFGCRQSTKRA